MPKEWSHMEGHELESFFADASKYKKNGLVYDNVASFVLEKKEETYQDTNVSGDFVPLSVLVMRGWDKEMVEDRARSRTTRSWASSFGCLSRR